MFIMPVVIMYNKDVNSCHGAGNRVISVLMCREQGSLLSLPVPKFINYLEKMVSFLKRTLDQLSIHAGFHDNLTKNHFFLLQDL